MGHWAFVHTALNAHDLLERLLNNGFPIPNSQCPKNPLLNKLYTGVSESFEVDG